MTGAEALERLPRSTRALRRRFATLSADDLAALAGTHEAVFVGPALLRFTAPRAIAVGGMPCWWGKRFAPGAEVGVLEGVNLLRDPRAPGAPMRETNPMRGRLDASWVDGRPALVVTYPGAGVPWRWVRDEFRVLGDGVLLGVSLARRPVTRHVAAPFVLRRVR